MKGHSSFEVPLQPGGTYGLYWDKVPAISRAKDIPLCTRNESTAWRHHTRCTGLSLGLALGEGTLMMGPRLTWLVWQPHHFLTVAPRTAVILSRSGGPRWRGPVLGSCPPILVIRNKIKKKKKPATWRIVALQSHHPVSMFYIVSSTQWHSSTESSLKQMNWTMVQKFYPS